MGGKRTGGHKYKTTSGNNQNYSITEICQNNEMSPGEFKRLAVTPVKDPDLTFMFSLVSFHGISAIVGFFNPISIFIHINGSILNNSVKHKYTV